MCIELATNLLMWVVYQSCVTCIGVIDSHVFVGEFSCSFRSRERGDMLCLCLTLWALVYWVLVGTEQEETTKTNKSTWLDDDNTTTTTTSLLNNNYTFKVFIFCYKLIKISLKKFIIKIICSIHKF
jgi:hypothetical protein